MMDVEDSVNLEEVMPIGQDNRFDNGQGFPPGLGILDRDLGPILNINEINKGLEELGKVFPEVKLTKTSHRTSQGYVVYSLAVGEPRVLIHSGMYGRDRGGPDHLIYFLSDLLHARKRNLGLRYGNKQYTPEDVVKALSAGILALPLVNPDGVDFDQGTDLCWLKNRRPFYPNKFLPTPEVGVNLNRNFKFVWDFEKSMNPNLPRYFADNSSEQDFRGPKPFSEPETLNILLSKYDNPSLSWFVGLFSTPNAGSISWGWTHAETQSTDTSQNFHNSSYDGKRAFIDDRLQHEFAIEETGNAPYAEFMDSEAVLSQEKVCKRMAEAAGEFAYHSNFLGKPTSGNSADWAASAYYEHPCRATRINSLNINFGHFNKSASCGFYPNRRVHYDSMRRVSASLMELLLYAANDTITREKC